MQIGGKSLPELTGAVMLKGRGALVFVATDASALDDPTPDQIESALEHLVQHSIAPPNVIDSETKIVVDGASGREVVYHAANLMGRERVVLHRKHIYALSGEGLSGSGVPREYERFEQSFKMR